MDVILEKLHSPILTIPGIGTVNGACIWGESGDISRFSNATQLAAYAGIDASVSQSGGFQSTNNRMNKRGSPYLRKALYQKKRAEGKHHLTAIGAVARKLYYVMFAVLKNNETYRPQSF